MQSQKYTSQQETEQGDATVKMSTILWTIGIVILVVFIIASIAVYFFPKTVVARSAVRILPYPAVVVDMNNFILLSDVNKNLASIRRFYENQSDDFARSGMRVDFSTPEGEKRLKIREKELLNTLIEDKAVRILAKERNIEVSDQEAADAVNKKLQEYGSQKDVEERLRRLYGWTLPDFEQKIVLPELYRTALQQAYDKENATAEKAKAAIGNAGQELKKGAVFDDVARKYSQGDSAQNGGELGWIPADALVPEIRDVVKKQPLQRVSDVIESSIGFHIILVEDKKQENEQQVVRLKQVFVRKSDFSEWFLEEMHQMGVRVLLREYAWNKSDARIEFKQSEMKLFEDEILKNSDGDASILF